MEKDYKFWNDNSNVKYFKGKPADPLMVEYLKRYPDKEAAGIKALDLGCGGGRHTELLVTKGFQTYAVDINSAMLEATKARVDALKLDNTPEIKEGSITEIPFQDNFFDIVITTGVLHQAKSQEEYRQAISELSRVCKKGAIILLNIFTNRDLDPTYTYLDDERTVVQTKEGLLMTLLPKELFYSMMKDAGLFLEEEYIEELKEENTGPRTVLRARFVKR
ncbi:MAG TPA: class I SAM-dependent methyltransferase [Verrucomicrobiae bacterium]|nr:class I SAM-dependent methyltransferase [Verrucomicrobiae bacterium]